MSATASRRGGTNMRFDPNSLLLFVEGRRADATFLSVPDAPPGERGAADPVRQRIRLVHELDHLRRHLGTSYGLFRHAASSLLVRATAERLAARRPRGAADPVPFVGTADGEYCRDLVRSPVLSRSRKQMTACFRHPAESRRLLYVALAELVRQWDGLPPLADPHLAALALRAIGDAFAFSRSPGHSDPSGLLTPDEPLRQYLRAEYPYCPFLAGRPLGGHAVLEFFGVYREATEHAARGLERRAWTDFAGQGEYLRVVDHFLTAVCGFPADGRFPVEFDAVAELALWPPVTPDGILTAGRPLSWFDLQPGWRFLTACEYLRASRREWRYADADDLHEHDEWLPRIQDEVCDALGWPRVGAVAARWQAFLDGRPAARPLHPAWLDGGRTALAATALRERLARPFTAFLRRDVATPDTPEMMFPGMVFRDAAVLLPSAVWRGPEGAETNWWDHWLVNGSRFFAEGPGGQEYFRPADAEAAVSFLGTLSEALGGDADRTHAALTAFTEGPLAKGFWAWRGRHFG